MQCTRHVSGLTIDVLDAISMTMYIPVHNTMHLITHNVTLSVLSGAPINYKVSLRQNTFIMEQYHNIMNLFRNNDVIFCMC